MNDRDVIRVVLHHRDGTTTTLTPDDAEEPREPVIGCDGNPTFIGTAARLQQVRENIAATAPEVAAAAEAQAGLPRLNPQTGLLTDPDRPTPEMRMALKQAWLDEGGNPDDTRAMWAAFNPILGRRSDDDRRFTAVEIDRLLERRKAWSPKRRAQLLDAPAEPPRGLEAS